jgi:hypothetical protein
LSDFYVSEHEISERANLLRDIAIDLLAQGILPEKTLIFKEARIPLLAKGYFLLTKAYKDWRLPHGHFTEKPKIAALQAICISQFQPFFPVNPTEAQTISEARCNEIFACAYALGIIERKFEIDTPERRDFWLRLLDILSGATIETLEPFIADVNYQIKRPLPEYTLTIHKSDRLIINSLISIFELLSAKGKLLID